MKTASGLISFIENFTPENSAYWFGTIAGQKATTQLLNAKVRQYPAHYTQGRMARYKTDIANNKKVTDCSGLIKGYLMDYDGTYKYTNKYDMSADSMIAHSKRSGNIDTLPEIPGIALWRPGHVAVYLGNGKYKEAAGFSAGIRIAANIGSFRKWFYVPDIEYQNTAPEISQDLIEDIARRTIRGEFGNLPERRIKLNSLGYGSIYEQVQNRVNEILSHK